MPLPKRLVEPVHVARATLPDDFPLPSELEAVTNGTLANTVRQLSSLSRHAEDLFGELTRDAQQLNDRSNSLQARIDRLAIKVTQLDSNVEEVSLQDIHMRKAFKSNNIFDQQIFSRATMPTAMLETYMSCDKPPPLDKLNCYRDDGKDGLKFYTDPNYFFELWKQEMLKDTERVINDKVKKPRPRTGDGGHGGGGGGGGGRHKKRVRQPFNTRERQKQIVVQHGEYIMPMSNLQSQQQYGSNINNNNNSKEEDGLTVDQRPPRPNSIELNRIGTSTLTAANHHLHHQVDGPGGGLNSPQYVIKYDENPYQSSLYQQQQQNLPQQHQQEAIYVGTPTRKSRPTHPPPAPPSNTSTPSASNTPTRTITTTNRDNLPPPPPPPSAETLSSPPPPLPPNGIVSPIMREQTRSTVITTATTLISAQIVTTTSSTEMNNLQDELLPPPPPVPNGNNNRQQSPPKQMTPVQIPPPPPPPPLPMMPLINNNNATVSSHSQPPTGVPPSNAMMMMNGDLAKVLIGASPPKLTPVKDRQMKQQPPLIDPRNDLLKAIRDGIKLRKVEKIEQKEVVERGNGLHDVASILARRVAVEFSDSDTGTESECDSEGWGENETSA